MTVDEFFQNERIILESEVEIQNIQISLLKEEIKKLKKEKEEIKESMQCTLAFLEECKARNLPGEKK